jgi:RNA polymerase sigma-70 factor (ECF subfamily)
LTIIAFAILNHYDSYNEYDLQCQLAAGSEYAFTRLFDHYRGTIYSVGLKFLKSPVLAEEIVQDVFLKVWHKREEMASVKRLDAYLFIMARNFIFDRIKKMSYEAVDEISALELHSSTDDTEYLVRQHQCQQLLQQAIDMLPSQQRQVYQFAKQDGLSHEMIAEKMQLSRLTVKKHMAMALQSIRKHLESHLHYLPLLPLLISVM